MSKTYRTNLPVNLLTLRKQKCLSQEKLTDDIYNKTNFEIPRQRYHGYESGLNEPNLEFLIRISEYHQVSIDSLLLESL